MNEIFAPPLQRSATQAAEGVPRWRWTVAEIEKMAAGGFFHQDERIELVGGEIVPMSPKGRRHELVRDELTFRFFKLARPGIFVSAEPQFNLGPDTYTMPDVLVRPAAIKTPDLRGGDALLVVEIADTSVNYDLNTKAPIYAAHGVREYWVISAATLTTTVHREPSGSAYADVHEVSPDKRLVPLLVPELAVSLSELDLD
jgi:Uma2 family endonuclease